MKLFEITVQHLQSKQAAPHGTIYLVKADHEDHAKMRLENSIFLGKTETITSIKEIVADIAVMRRY